ncbi:MAG: nucleotidyltransferase domain-containing protein [Egibacteraceae bacterium]
MAADAFGPFPVRFAYFFGSQVAGRPRPDSDVDVAILADDAVPEEAYDRLALGLGLYNVSEVTAVALVDQAKSGPNCQVIWVRLWWSELVRRPLLLRVCVRRGSVSGAHARVLV